MPTITVDGQPIECRDGVPVLQAVLEAGVQVPHYCYHPGLSIVASCRLCLMEMKMPHPRTRELDWAPKLFPSCQTPVRDGLEVRFDTDRVRGNQQHVMEYYLLNHPLDCPVCDKAGECYLQDYTEEYGQACSRMVEDKHKNPKKDIGPHTLLHQDRCVLCTRCVRFAREVAGTGELLVADRGSRGEIDVFPGLPLENRLQGNVVDLCPVGALIDKGFLFRRRVWELRSARSVCAGCSRGCTIHADHADGRAYRIRPRFNERVNEWWICDDGRFKWKYIHREDRLRQPRLRRGTELVPTRWEELPSVLRVRFEQAAEADDGAAIGAVLSPMMSCEEAFLLARFVRGMGRRATLASGYLPVVGEDESFANGFIINAEKCPNRRGVQDVIDHFGGNTIGFDDFLKQAGEGKLKAVYLAGGYSSEWVAKELTKAAAKIDYLVVHDLFGSPLEAKAAAVIPGASWLEREGTFVNGDGLVQPFERALTPLEGVKADGQFLFELCGGKGLFRARKVREALAETLPQFAEPFVPREEPAHAH